jgi:hypothetical protein
MSYISIKNFSQLSKLDENDVIQMMLNGINFLDGSILTFVSQIKNFEQEIMHTKESISILRKKITSKDFQIKQEDNILTIQSKMFPPSLFFAQENWEDELNGFISAGEYTSLLIPHRDSGSLFISDEKTIIRLSDSFEGIFDILALEDIKNMNFL